MLAIARRSARRPGELGDSVESQLELVGPRSRSTIRCGRPQPRRSTRRATLALPFGCSPATILQPHARSGTRSGSPSRIVYARATPAVKLALVEDAPGGGEVVAVTGDGVNDAPALRRADVGVAMGQSGTEAAREAAAIVLTDDDFATIVAAIHEGRLIGDNIRKFVAFLLSANLGEVLVFAVAIVSGMGAPLAVIQVLLVNLVTDGPPALALTQDPAPRPTDGVGAEAQRAPVPRAAPGSCSA